MNHVFKAAAKQPFRRLQSCFLIALVVWFLSSSTIALAQQQIMIPTLSYLLEEDSGHFGVPSSTFTIPLTDINNDDGLYIIDIQAKYPQVDWATLDRLYLPAFHYKFIRIGNLPSRNANRPLVITNKGGQVRVGAKGHYYLLSLSGGSNWILTGRYDPISQTGDEHFPGHANGQYANSYDTYGLLIDDDFGLTWPLNNDDNPSTYTSYSGLSIAGATDFEIEFMEIRHITFAGMSIKTDNQPSRTMHRVSVHDNYIHDTISEGVYFGSTSLNNQHQLRDWRVFNNRILRTGTEGLQIGQLAGTSRIYNNVVGPCALDWRAAFQQYQDSCLQIGLREGSAQVYNNIFIGAANTQISMFYQQVAGDDTQDNVGISFTDNYFDATRWLAMYASLGSGIAGMTTRLQRNVFRGHRFERDEVYESTEATNHMLRLSSGSVSPFVFTDNIWSGYTHFSNVSNTGNGTSGIHSGSGNLLMSADRIEYRDSGFDDNFDYLTLELWTNIAVRNQANPTDPVSYEQNDIVMYHGLPYRCKLDPCAANMKPTEHSEVWEQLALFADDVRVKAGTTWEHLGIRSD